MLKDSTAVIGLGLGGMTVTYEFQERNYLTYSVNGSEQDIKSIPNAKNSMRLEGYDGLAGNRELAYEALKRNKHILKKLKEIEKKINIVIASGGGSSGSGCITFVSEILVQNPDKIVVPVILMPRQDESIQKRLNAYNVAKELMQIEELGAIIFVNNESYSDLKKINTILVNMLDAFLSDTSYSSGSNFDDSEKMKMLKDNGAFVIAMLSDKNSENNRVTTADMVKALTVKNIFLPINADGIVGNLGIINQGKNKIDEHEIEKAIGVPENIFTGSNGAVNIACASGLKNANSYRQSIISIVINQAKAVQDAMFKEIDARKKALKKKKEYYDYDKTIKKKTDEIEFIKQQIRGLEGLTDAESKAQKARLEASLKDKQDDLDDTVRDHVYDITVNGLDDLETQLSEDFEKWSNQLSSDLAKMSDAISDAISGAGENYSDMMAGINYILNNIGGISSGQYFTNQDKSNMKNSNSLDTGYNPGHLKGYAKGTKRVGSNRIAMTNENGREIIVTKDGWITPLEASDMVIPNDITETLIDMAERQQNYAMNGNFKMPELKVKDASGNSVNNVYNTFTVQGDLTRDTLPELNKILDLASSKTQNDIRKNKRRFG